MWTYTRTKGIFEKDKIRYINCYSGHGEGLNNPAMESVHNIGPLPANLYTMTALINSPHTGPNTIVLVPSDGINKFGRSEFRIHGDNEKHDFSASDGCIILFGGQNRIDIWNSNDHTLQVI